MRTLPRITTLFFLTTSFLGYTQSLTIDTPVAGDDFVNAAEASSVLVSGTYMGIPADNRRVIGVIITDHLGRRAEAPAIFTTMSAMTGLWRVTIDVSGLADGRLMIRAVNASVAFAAEATNNNHPITLDRTPPSITSVTTNTPVIGESNAGVGGFYITVGFNEPMTADGTKNPSVTFDNSAEDPATTLSSPVYTWPTDTTLRVAYTVSDVNADLADIDVLIDGGQDAAGNDITPANTSRDDLFSINTQNLPMISGPANNPTNLDPVPVSVDFGKPVAVLSANDLTITNGTLTGGSIRDDGFGRYSFTIDPAADGPVGVDIRSILSITIEYDGTAPTPAISGPANDPTNSNPVPVSVDFGEAMTGFAANDLMITNGTLTGGSFMDNGSGRYSFTIDPAADGPVDVSISSDAARDIAGNSSQFASFTIEYDGTAPTPAISSPEEEPTNSDAVPVSVDFGEAMIGFAASDLVIMNGTLTGGSFRDNGGGRYSFTIDPAADGPVDVSISSDAARDIAGNYNQFASLTIEYDGTAPFITVQPGTGNATPDFSGTIDDMAAAVIISVGGQTRSSTNNPAIQIDQSPVTAADGRPLPYVRWNYTSSLDPTPIKLPARLGLYEVIALAIDKAGNSRTDTTKLEYEYVGGAKITPASPAPLCESGGFQPLGRIEIGESENGDFGKGVDSTLLLTLPAGFEFDPGTPTGFAASSLTDISGITSTFVGTTSLRITMTVTGTTGLDTVRIDDLRVKVVTGGSSGNLIRAGGTASLFTNDTNYASLSSDAASPDPADLRETSHPAVPLTSFTTRFLPRVAISYAKMVSSFTDGEDVVFDGGATGTMVRGTLTDSTFRMDLTSGTIEAGETFTGQSSSLSGTTTAVAGISDELLPFTLEASTTGIAHWYDDTGRGISSLAANNNTTLSATAPGLYTYEITDANAVCESNPLRFNVHIYNDVHPDHNESTFRDKTYTVLSERDTIYLSNPAGHTVTVTGSGVSMVGGGADPLLAIFDPAIAGDDGSGGLQRHTITYTITNTTTMESATETVVFTVEPRVSIFTGSIPDQYCPDSGTTSFIVDASGFNSPGSTPPYIDRIVVRASDTGSGTSNVSFLDGARLSLGGVYGQGSYEYDWDPSTFNVPDGEFRKVTFTRVIRDDNGFRTDAENAVFIYGSPYVELPDLARNYCEDDASFTLRRDIRYVRSVDDTTYPPVGEVVRETNQAITNGYLLYRIDGVTSTNPMSVLYQDFTSSGPYGVINHFDPADPDQDNVDDPEDVGDFRIVYNTEPLTPGQCTGQQAVTFTVHGSSSVPTLNAATLSGAGVAGTIANSSPAAGVDGRKYLLEYCTGAAAGGGFATDATNVKWYDGSFNPIPAFDGMNTITPAAVGLSYSGGRFNVAQMVDFYFTSTNATGCESDYRLVTVRIYERPDAPMPDVTGWPASVQTSPNEITLDYCIPRGGVVTPDPITLRALNAGERYDIRDIFYFDNGVSAPTQEGFIYEFDISGVSGTFTYGDHVRVPGLGIGIEGFFHSWRGSAIMRLVLNDVLTSTSPVTVFNAEDGSSTAMVNDSRLGYALPDSVINFLPLMGDMGGDIYIKYRLYKTAGIDPGSNFAGCPGPDMDITVQGWLTPADPTVADLQAGVTTFHVSEGGTLADISHTSVGMDGYVWYEHSDKTGMIGTDTIPSLAAMTHAILTARTSFNPGTVAVPYVNDSSTYYFSRIDRAVLQREFDGCESAGTQPVHIIVHARQRKPVIASDNSASTVNTAPFANLNSGAIRDRAVDYFYSVCADRLEAANELDATEPIYGGQGRIFRWYAYDINTGMRGAEYTTDGSGTATFTELQLTRFSAIATATDEYFEVVQITDNDVYGGVESENTLIRVQISPQDMLEFRDSATGFPFPDEFCRDEMPGSIAVDLYSGGSSAGSANVAYEIDSYMKTNYDLSLLKTATITHTASAPYMVGEIVAGIASGASAAVVTDDGSTMTIQNISGTFQVADTIQGALSGIKSAVGTVTETTPGPDVDGVSVPGNPTLNFRSLHDAVPGAMAVGGEATVHVLTMSYTAPFSSCEASVSKTITIYPKPHISIEVNGVDINDGSFSGEFCYENFSVALRGVQYIYGNTGITDTISLGGGGFTSSITGDAGAGDNGLFNPLTEHNAFHGATLTNGEFLNRSDIDIVFSYTDGFSCENNVMTTLFVDPLPEAIPITGLPVSDLAEANISNNIRITNSCIGSGAVTAEIQIVDPVHPDPGSAEENDYSMYTFTWTANGSAVADLNLDGLPNTIEFVPPSNSLTLSVTVEDLNGCTKTYTEDHDLQDLPDLDITGVVDNQTFCANGADPVIGLQDGTSDGTNTAHTAAAGDIVSWFVDSYNQADGMTAMIRIASGTGTLPGVDLDAWHMDASLATPGTLVGGSPTVHRITIVYDDPSREYQGIATTCSNTVAETIIVTPDPDITITLGGLDMDDAEFCYDDTNIVLQGFDLGAGVELNEGVFNQISIDGIPVSSNGSGTIDADAYHAAVPGTVSPGDAFLPQSRHTVEYGYEDANGCRRTITRDFLINPRPGFVGNVIQAASTCVSGFIELFVDMTDGASNYRFTWFVNGRAINGVDAVDQDGNNNDERVTFDLAGRATANFGVRATYTGGGFSTSCTASILNQNITVGAEPIPAITWVGITSGNPRGTSFTITEDNAALSDGDVDLVLVHIGGMKVLDVPNPAFPLNFTHFFTTPGEHTVEMVMKTTAGCLVSLNRTVRILPHYTSFNATNSYSESFESPASFDLTRGGWLIDSLSLDGKHYYDTAASWVQGDGALIPGTSGNIDGIGAVVTAPGGANGYREAEVSFVYSPSFDLNGFTSPTVSFLRYEDFETFRDGVVFQVSVDDGRTWQTVGAFDPDLEAEGLASTPGWYNREAISSGPGSVAPGSATASNPDQLGWALRSDWQEAISPIEIDPAKDDYVRFRFALAAQAGTKVTNGFGFDLFRIYERDQIVLIETFSSSLTAASEVFNDTVDVSARYAGKDIIKINYFTDLANGNVIDQINKRNVTDPGAKVAFYGIGTVPSIAISGDVNSVDLTPGMFTLLNAKLANARVNNPAFDISLTASVDRKGNLVINSADYTATTAFGASQEVTLIIAVTEPEVVLPVASGMYAAGDKVRNVLRTLLPSAAGQYEAGPIAAGETRSLTNLSWPVSNMYDPSTVRVIAYVQDLNTRQVYQAAFVDLATGLSSNVLGLEEFSDLKVYPNPVDKVVTIVFADGPDQYREWIIFDQTGREVLKGEIEKGTQTLTVETSDLPSGLYFINLYEEDKTSVKRRVMVLH